MRPSTKQFLFSIPASKIGLGFAWLGVLIYAASNSVVTLLVDIGAQAPVSEGRNAITFGNLLLLGSIISLIPMILLFGKDWNRTKLRNLTLRDWGLMQIAALLSSAITPGLFFFALEHSSVTNVVLVSRIEPPLFLLAAAVFLKERVDPRALGAGVIALFGAALMISLRENVTGGVFGIGEIAAAGATLSYIASAIVARHALGRIPLGIFSIYRTAMGAVTYFVLMSVLQGPQTFRDILSPVILSWVWIYAIPVVLVGQLAWFVALKHARASDMSLATSFSPLAGIVFAMLLLGEDPGAGFIPGAVIILLAIFVARMKAPILQRLRRTWQARPTYGAGDIAEILVPAAAFPGATRRAYNGSY
ncbi:MAG: DMT family transporter [Pseudomonadota bacterium]